MTSILVFHQNFNPAQPTTWPAARRLGQAHCGRRLAHWLRAKDDYNNEYSAFECVYRTLSDSNKDTWGVWIEYQTNQYIRIDKIRNKGNRIVLVYDNPDDGSKNRLRVYVAEDDDGIDKRMTVSIPENRLRITSATPYVVDVATDIAAVFGDGSGTRPLDAGLYALSSITFRRCA